jgi:ABC-type uncharacterized transport system auxiliary subunit
MSRILAITLILLGTASAAQADVYRWTDADGTVKFSDRWVPGSVLVKTDKPSTTTSSPAARATSAPAGTAARGDEILAAQREQRTVQQDMAKVKAEQCKKARETYDKAIQSPRIFKQAANGEREYLSDADADAYRAELLRNRKATCGS